MLKIFFLQKVGNNFLLFFVLQMEGEAKDIMTSSAISGDTTNSSDNESWTILDEDEVVDSSEENVLNTRIDVVQNVAEFSKRSIPPPIQHRDSDSDIETIDESNKISAESNLDSLNSDGIPVGEELSESGAQYLWSSEGGDLSNQTGE